MDNPSDEAIAEALRLAGYAHSHQSVMAVLDEPDTWRETIAHARTIDQRNKLVEALEKIEQLTKASFSFGAKMAHIEATQALTQFRSGQ